MAEYKRVSEENLLYFATKTAQKVKAMIGGFNPTSIVFGADGSITETASTGTKVTTFSGNTITETLTWNGGTREIKTTTFNADGTITITYS